MGSVLGRIRLEPDEQLRGSGTDIDSFFNQLRQHESALPRSAVGRRVSAEEARERGVVTDEPRRQVVRVVGMGHLNSPAIAQQLHLSVLADGGLDTDSFLEYGSPLPRASTYTGVFYDVLVVVAKVSTAKVRVPGPDSEQVQQALDAYDHARLPVARSKSFGAAREGSGQVGDTSFIAWGTQVHSFAGKAATKDIKRALLAEITSRALQLQKCDGSFLRRLSSCYVHPCGHHPERSCVFHRFHKIRSEQPDTVARKLPADIKDELTAAALQLPVACAHFRWPVDTSITCSDATPDSGANVDCQVRRELASALFDTAEARGLHLPMNAVLITITKVEECMPDDPVVDEVVGALQWAAASSRNFSESTHVNLREPGEVAKVLEQATEATLLPQRKVNGSDSLVSKGAWAKGRSPSFKINSLLRKRD